MWKLLKDGESSNSICVPTIASLAITIFLFIKIFSLNVEYVAEIPPQSSSYSSLAVPTLSDLNSSHRLQPSRQLRNRHVGNNKEIEIKVGIGAKNTEPFMGDQYIANFLAKPEDSACNEKQKVYAGIIHDIHKPKDPLLHYAYEYVRNFTLHVFDKAEDPIQMKVWPQVYSKPCDGNVDAFDKGRGSNLAHREIWLDFYQTRRRCGFQANDVLIVFEDDAFEGVPNAGELAIEYVRNMTTDVMWLGYCYQYEHDHPSIGGKVPFCLHAYAITLPGAKKLLELLSPCSIFADAQLFNGGNMGLISWSYADQPYDRPFVNDLFRKLGVRMSGDFEYAGIFVQGKFHKRYADGVIAHNQHHHVKGELFLLKNQTWRSIPSMDVVYKLGLDIENVQLLTGPHFNLYPTGPPLTLEEYGK